MNIRFYTATSRECTLLVTADGTTFEQLIETISAALHLTRTSTKLYRSSRQLRTVADVLSSAAEATAAATLQPISASDARDTATPSSPLPGILVVGAPLRGCRRKPGFANDADSLVSRSQEQQQQPHICRTPQTPQSTLSTRSSLGGATLRDVVDHHHSGPLRFPHVPAGLSEIYKLVGQLEGDSLAAVYQALCTHPTVSAMRDTIALGDADSASAASSSSSSSTKSELALRELLIQIREAHPPLFEWIQSHSVVFLSLLNNAPNPFASNEVLSMLYDLRSIVGEVFDVLGVRGQSGGTASIEVSDGDAIFVVQAGGAQDEDVVLPDSISGSAPHSARSGTVFTIRRINEAEEERPLNPQEEVAQLEEALRAADRPLVEASLLREIIYSYDAMHSARVRGATGAPLAANGNAVQKAPLAAPQERSTADLEGAIGYYFARLMTTLLRCARDTAVNDITSLQTLAVLGPSSYVAAQVWFKDRDSMNSVAACLAHLTFWEILDKLQNSAVSGDGGGGGPVESHEDPTRSLHFALRSSENTDDIVSYVSNADRANSSRPGTAIASLVSQPSSTARLTYTTTDDVQSTVTGSVDSLISDPFQETMRLMRYTSRHQTTIVLYSLLGEDSLVIYVLRNGSDIRVLQTSIVVDGFKGSILFVEEALRRRRFGVNLHMLWTEHLTEMYRALVQPVEHLLPDRPSELDDPISGTVCFIVSFSSVPLPFSAMLDENGVPVAAKWAAYQAHIPADLFAAESPEFAPVISTMLTESTPAWLTRHLARTLNATTLRPPGQRALILHVDNVESYAVATLPSSDFFVCEKFVSALRYNIRRAALVRGMTIHPDDDALPYEFSRTLYTTLVDGHSIARATRLATLATMRAYPLEPWRWGSMMLFNYGGHLPPLEHHVERLVMAQQRREVEIDRSLRAVAATPESRYSDVVGVNGIYNSMLVALLAAKPDSRDGILDCLIAALEAGPQETRSNRGTSTPSNSTSSRLTPRMVPVPPDKPPANGKPRPGPPSGPLAHPERQ